MHRFGWLLIALLVTGCTNDMSDPYLRPGTWNPTADNDANLRAMVANPHDLVEGTGQGASAGAEAAPPVARVLAGKRYPLPALNASDINITAEPAQQGAANPGSAQ
jgi:hypothetical protein